MSVRLITPAALLPITLAEAKSHLRVDVDDEDSDIDAYLRAAVAHAESFMGRSLMEQTFDYAVDAFPANSKPLTIPMAPLIAVDGLFQRGSDGDEDELSGFLVDTHSQPGKIYLSSGTWPTGTAPGSVRVRYRAGYVTVGGSPPAAIAGEVPPDIIAAVKLMLGHWYANREDVIVGTSAVTLPLGAEVLMRRHRLELSLA